MMLAAEPAMMWRRANSLETKNVPLRVMSTTVRQAFGDMSSAGTGKLAAALLTNTPGSPNVASAESKAALTASGSRMSQTTEATGAPIAPSASRPTSRCSGLRLAITRDAPSLANSEAMPSPSPVPPPVTNTVTPANVSGGNADDPRGGGSGSPRNSNAPESDMSAPPVAGITVLGAGVLEFGKVVALVEEGLVDHLVFHRRPQSRPRQM